MSARRCCLWAAILSVALTASAVHHVEEDFAFDSPFGETADEVPSPASATLDRADPTPAPVQRLWGVPDTSATVGKLFQLRIPQDAFSGSVDHYETRGQGSSGPLPSWLLFDKTAGLFEGVPSAKDVGESYVTVRAVGLQAQDWAKDVFSVEVLAAGQARQETLATAAVPLRDTQHKVKCAAGEDPTVVKIVIDVKYEHLKPKQRVAAIKNLAGFLALHYSLFQLIPQSSRDSVLLGDAVVLAGPGNVKRRASKQASILQWQAGCDGRLMKPHASLVAQLKQQAKDGTIAEVVALPVVGWHVETRTAAAHRERRETGSGDSEIDYEEEEYEDEEDVTESIPEVRIVPAATSPVFAGATSVHPHRHHHGEEGEVDPIDTSMPEPLPTVKYGLPSSPLLYGTIVATPVLIPVRPTRLLNSEVLIEPSRAYTEYAPSATPVFVTEVEPSVSHSVPDHVTEPLPTSYTGGSNETDDILVDSNLSGTSGSSTDSPTVSTTSEEPVTLPPTYTTNVASTPKLKEEIVLGVKNIQPIVEHRLPRIPVTAGKALRYIIPENAFSDLEDGNTRNLRLIFKTSEGRSVSSTSWVQFNPKSQEVYALPLEEHVSKWTYNLEAMDKEGSTVSDSLELLIQHHKGRRTVNYEFSLHLRIEKKLDFPSSVDWQLRVLDGLARLYGNSDASQITVLNITNTDPIVFSWTNDSLPRSNCPKAEINELRQVLIDENGDPSLALREILSPELRVKRVTYQGLGQCEISHKPDVRLPLPPIRTTEENFRPSVRNQVDHINATVGELLLFIVPEDTFYDPEDGNTRNLKLSLMTMDRLPIPASHWLQFDVKNQEFFGIPMASDEGRKEYQLVGEDSGGHTANDGLVIVVHPAHKLHYNVEFSMKLGTPYEAFIQSASMKRKFIDKLKELFGDRNSSAIALSGVIEGSTIVTWHNRTLPTDYCPEEEIRKLRRVLIKDDDSISDRVNQILGPEFPVANIVMTPTGACQGELSVIHTPEGPPPPSEEARPTSSSDEYLITFVVPAVIIAAMLILAGIVACVLYRRRRTGKMSVGDEDERQSFRNKGIPVIFQDELEDRPDPENKSPVIMKEEKPPLPPPEYRRDELERSATPPTASHPLLGEQEDPPYQPPPPFTASRDTGRQNRPKPTPTYRKPPPYVPP